MVDSLKGTKIDKEISKIQAMNSLELQLEIIKNFTEIPNEHRVAFEFVMKKKWNAIVATYSSLTEKSYEELKELRKPLRTLGDLSGSEVPELVLISTANETVYKDPKVEMYLIKRLTNTRTASRLIDRIRSLFSF